MEITKMIRVMVHFNNGGKVGQVKKNSINKPTHSIKEPKWNWLDYDYKVMKP